MRFSVWGRRAAIAGCGVAAMLAVMPVASADTTDPATPGYAPITLSPQEAQQLCADLLPRLANRTTKLVDRINGGADERGSVAWLKARAQTQRTKGHDQIADQLDQRAQRRADRANDLKSIQQRLDTFRTNHCKVTS
ncbi:MAG TPA: hypothetical protein VJT49_00530 [Amycolatopsis sp.]|uniref:hypothetical protein n=1 Tax=Amycolatopsis sp. TaxID=37632 RepID=UPI002B477006|nr:hypothetical protein [Amycolatopsis sp.]HKS43600.1 hypothetical protein [Amycolatopsis sp.]